MRGPWCTIWVVQCFDDAQKRYTESLSLQTSVNCPTLRGSEDYSLTQTVMYQQACHCRGTCRDFWPNHLWLDRSSNAKEMLPSYSHSKINTLLSCNPLLNKHEKMCQATSHCLCIYRNFCVRNSEMHCCVSFSNTVFWGTVDLKTELKRKHRLILNLKFSLVYHLVLPYPLKEK